MPKKDKRTVIKELSPPQRRLGLKPDIHTPPILLENEVFLEVNSYYGQRDTFPELASLFFMIILSFFFILIWHGATLSDIPSFLWAVACIPLLMVVGTLLTRSPLPLRLNRQTQEAYFVHGGKLYRMPWQQIMARVTVTYTPAVTAVYSLDFGFFRGKDKTPMWVAVGGSLEEIAYRHWEYYCMYMESGTPVPLLDVVPEEEKSEARKHQEKPLEKLIDGGILGVFKLIFWPMEYMEKQLTKVSLRPNRWPQEIIDVCENHPLLKN
ncbi:MAG: DUF6708 domain-containing protein [Desulfuromonas sp.]